jgi:hypothetical protein
MSSNVTISDSERDSQTQVRSIRKYPGNSNKKTYKGKVLDHLNNGDAFHITLWRLN